MEKLTTQKLPHKMPKDLRETLKSHPEVHEKWDTLTPLAQNEWICWVAIVKKAETRQKHLDRLCEDLRKGKRRPCCPQRRPSAQKWFK